jgi:hypothetical protein
MIDRIGMIAAATGLGGVPDDAAILRRVETCPIDDNGPMGDGPLTTSILKAVDVAAAHHEIFARFCLWEGRPPCWANPVDGSEIRLAKRNRAVAGGVTVEVGLYIANLVVRKLELLEHAHDHVTKAVGCRFRPSRMHRCSRMEAAAKRRFIKPVDSPRVALEYIFDLRPDQQMCR